jgi:hypothetical protein
MASLRVRLATQYVLAHSTGSRRVREFAHRDVFVSTLES